MSKVIGKTKLILVAAVVFLGLAYVVWTQAGVVALHGTVIRKEWTKTGESWNAGGSEYYVLDVGDAPIQRRSAREGVILRPSGSLPFSEFAAYTDQQVVVTGRFVSGKQYNSPPGIIEQQPVGYDGQAPIRGSGFQVHSIDVTDGSDSSDEPSP